MTIPTPTFDKSALSANIMNTPVWYKTSGIHGQCFPSKAAVKSAVRERISRLQVSSTLSSEDFIWFLDLLRWHPEWDEKCGCGVSELSLRVNRSAAFSTKGLWITRTDGSEVDISWVACIDGASGHSAQVRSAARLAVVDQVKAVREKFIGTECPICGQPLLDNTHVDHAHPFTFDQVLKDWLASEGGVDEVEVSDAGTHSVMADCGQLQRWQQWHAWWADLRLIHSHENLSIGKESKQ